MKRLPIWLQILLIVAVAYGLYLVANRLFVSFKMNTLKASGAVPTEADRVNAGEIDNNVYWAYENEEKIIDIVKRYNSDTYPRLKVAYYEMFGSDLTANLKSWLSASEFYSIKNIATI